MTRFGRGNKLSPHFIGPFNIIEWIGEIAYRLALPPQISDIHNVFHISMLRKYQPNLSHVLEWNGLELEADVSFEEKPLEILDRCDQVLRGKTIHLVKMLWSHHGMEEATWEREYEIWAKYPHLF